MNKKEVPKALKSKLPFKERQIKKLFILFPCNSIQKEERKRGEAFEMEMKML